MHCDLRRDKFCDFCFVMSFQNLIENYICRGVPRIWPGGGRGSKFCQVEKIPSNNFAKIKNSSDFIYIKIKMTDIKVVLLYFSSRVIYLCEQFPTFIHQPGENVFIQQTLMDRIRLVEFSSTSCPRR